MKAYFLSGSTLNTFLWTKPLSCYNNLWTGAVVTVSLLMSKKDTEEEKM